MKFDPIATITLLDPVKNEIIAENAARAIISTAGVVGYDLNPNETMCETKESAISSEMTLMILSDAEIREFKRNVMDFGSIEDGVDEEADTENEKNGLCPARMIYLRMMCEMIIQSKELSETKKASMMSRCVSDVTVLSTVLEKHMGRVQAAVEEDEMVEEEEAINQKEENECFICLHLLKLATVIDLNEEGSRRHLNSMIYRILSANDTHDDLIECCVHVLKASSDTETSFLQSISEIIADMIDLETFTDGEDNEDKKTQHLRAIEILSVALEKVSLQVSNNPILQNFSNVILATITDSSLGSMIREAGVSCLGRYIILLDEATVIEKFKPLLLEIAYMDSEKIEIRAQALLAISDIALRFERFMVPVVIESSLTNTPISVSDVIFDCMTKSTKSLLIVAAEVAAKLMFFGRLHDANILAHLIVLYFDQVFSSVEILDDVKEVGSPTRLQQLLTVFFPAYCMKSTIGKETLLACVSLVLTVVNDKIHTKKRGRKAYQWPITKMLDYVFDLAEKGNHAQEAGEPSHNLVILVAIATFLEEHADDLTTTFIRTLCKILGSTHLDVSNEEQSLMRRLKNSIEELTMHITDDSALRALQPLIEIVEDVHSDDESTSEKVSVCEENSNEDENTVSIGNDANSMPATRIDDESVTDKVSIDEEDAIQDENNVSFEKNTNSILETRVNDESVTDQVSACEEDAIEGERFVSFEDNTTSVLEKSIKMTTEKISRLSYEDTLPSFAMVGNQDDSNRKESVGSKSSRVSDGDDHMPLFATIGARRSARKPARRRRVIIESSESEAESDSSSSESEISEDEDSD